ncbi:MAG: hypothetical protein QNJ44_12765 [Rhodobacter sp.]|nr:hypothetical protein [Rhodobacter sp.]
MPVAPKVFVHPAEVPEVVRAAAGIVGQAKRTGQSQASAGKVADPVWLDGDDGNAAKARQPGKIRNG